MKPIVITCKIYLCLSFPSLDKRLFSGIAPRELEKIKLDAASTIPIFKGGKTFMRHKTLALMVMVSFMTLAIGCSAPLSTREKGGLIGTAVGSGSGAIIGSFMGAAAAGAAIGGPIGLLAGAFIGDQFMGQEQRQQDLQQQINANEAEIDRLRRENQKLKQQQAEP